MPAEAVLSTGCFIRLEDQLKRVKDIHVELSSHTASTLRPILETIKQNRIKVMSVHCPCPSRGGVPNLGSEPEFWSKSAEMIEEGMTLAASTGAKYLILHAFYCIQEDIPQDDLKRSIALRTIGKDGTHQTPAEYVRSDYYKHCAQNSINNLKRILPDLKIRYPNQKILIENLNPRIGYGGILLPDLIEIVEILQGDVGICLDVGHLALSNAVLGTNPDEQIRLAKDHILSTHLHQNFSGKYCVDRYWNSCSPQGNLQEIDIHFPLAGTYRKIGQVNEVWADNSAFAPLLSGIVQFCQPEDHTMNPSVPIEKWLSLLHQSTLRVFEFDSRYAPLEHILTEVALTKTGDHPVKLW